MPVLMILVTSSQIAYIGYDEDTKDLYVTFNNGSTYKYENVPNSVFIDFEQSESIGKYFSANIKDKYNTIKIK
jgi:hypothetical protein